jgi:hypothetical protein
LAAPDEVVGRAFREAVRFLKEDRDAPAGRSDEPAVQHEYETNLAIVRLRAEALEARKKLVAEGALVDSNKLAELLGVLRQAVNKAARANRLFSLDVGPNAYYPAFLADPDIDRRMLEKIVHLLGHLSGGSKWQFFTRPKGSLGGMTPLEALKRGQLEQVEQAAQAFVEG